MEYLRYRCCLLVKSIKPGTVACAIDKKGVRCRVRFPSGTLGVCMFFTFKKKRVANVLQKELDSFLSTRHGLYGPFSTIIDHRKFIQDFLSTTGVQTVEDIDRNTVDVYLEGVQLTERTEHRRLSAAVAIRQFIAYMDRKEINKQKGRLGRPPKTERNLEMVALRKFDPKKYSMGALAIKYKITKRAVWEILDRHKDMLQ